MSLNDELRRRSRVAKELEAKRREEERKAQQKAANELLERRKVEGLSMGRSLILKIPDLARAAADKGLNECVLIERVDYDPRFKTNLRMGRNTLKTAGLLYMAKFVHDYCRKEKIKVKLVCESWDSEERGREEWFSLVMYW